MIKPTEIKPKKIKPKKIKPKKIKPKKIKPKKIKPKKIKPKKIKPKKIKPKKIQRDWGDLIKAKARQRPVKAKAVRCEEPEDELTKVRALAPPQPSDDPIYDYLTGVYRLRCKVASSAELQNALQAYHKAHSPRTLQQYAGVIIQMTAGDHVTSNMKYKYVAALEYAFANSVKPKNLKAFIKRQGGLNKCVELWNRMAAKPQKSRERKYHEVPVINRTGCHSPEVTLADPRQI